jgi:ParB-like chromosome segregation protein Spo0J
MGWRDEYKVHPAADVFPMMSDEELDALGADIKANGLKHPIICQRVPYADDEAELPDELILLDGRNRLEAIERAGLNLYIGALARRRPGRPYHRPEHSPPPP